MRTMGAEPAADLLPEKAVATAKARAALAGHELVHLADGTFMIHRWGMFRHLEHLAAVDAFLRRVEGAPL